MSNQETVRKGLSVKDLVTTGIFTGAAVRFHDGGRCFLCNKPGTYVLYAGRQRPALRANLLIDGR